MRCPFCQTNDTKVIDSRLVGEGDQIRRRRECIQCEERFTTYEQALLTMPRLVKRDGRRVNFDEEKLRGGLTRALEKRPVEAERVEAAVSRIKHLLQSKGEREVSTSQLGEWVISELRALDEVAYVRFASVYRRFQDVNAFREEIERMKS